MRYSNVESNTNDRVQTVYEHFEQYFQVESWLNNLDSLMSTRNYSSFDYQDLNINHKKLNSFSQVYFELRRYSFPSF